MTDHHSVALLNAVAGQCQPPKPVFGMHVYAGIIENDIGSWHASTQFFQNERKRFQIGRILRAIGQTKIEI